MAHSPCVMFATYASYTRGTTEDINKVPKHYPCFLCVNPEFERKFTFTAATKDQNTTPGTDDGEPNDAGDVNTLTFGNIFVHNTQIMLTDRKHTSKKLQNKAIPKKSGTQDSLCQVGYLFQIQKAPPLC